jgi:CheY-like chemotaxis protein
VLYIEDDLDNITLVRILLQTRTHITLKVAMSARDGIDAAEQEPPDLILLDNRLPDAAGREVLGQLASSGVTAAIPVIVLSADSGAAIADELIRLGAVEFLVKPYDIHEFLSMIDRRLPSLLG